MSGKPIAAALSVLLLMLAGCGAGAQQRPTLTVLAAASLTESFTEIGNRFGEQHPEVRVRFDFQGSSLLAEQIRQGRTAGVFASADVASMRKVVRSGAAAGKPATFATNRLTIVVPPGNPADISALADLARPGTAVVLCAPQVPCGSAAERVQQVTGVRLSPVSEESDVKDVLHKVVAGEADAGLVYVTDARAAGKKVERIELAGSRKAINRYPIAVLKGAEHPALAERFARFVRGPAGQRILDNYGFGTP